MSFDYVSYDNDDDDIQGCIMMIPRDNAYESSKKKEKVIPKDFETDSNSSQGLPRRTPQRPSQPKKKQEVLNNVSSILSQYDESSAMNILETLMKNFQSPNAKK